MKLECREMSAGHDTFNRIDRVEKKDDRMRCGVELQHERRFTWLSVAGDRGAVRRGDLDERVEGHFDHRKSTLRLARASHDVVPPAEVVGGAMSGLQARRHEPEVVRHGAGPGGRSVEVILAGGCGGVINQISGGALAPG